MKRTEADAYSQERKEKILDSVLTKAAKRYTPKEYYEKYYLYYLAANAGSYLLQVLSIYFAFSFVYGLTGGLLNTFTERIILSLVCIIIVEVLKRLSITDVIEARFDAEQIVSKFKIAAFCGLVAFSMYSSSKGTLVIAEDSSKEKTKTVLVDTTSVISSIDTFFNDRIAIYKANLEHISAERTNYFNRFSYRGKLSTKYKPDYQVLVKKATAAQEQLTAVKEQRSERIEQALALAHEQAKEERSEIIQQANASGYGFLFFSIFAELLFLGSVYYVCLYEHITYTLNRKRTNVVNTLSSARLESEQNTIEELAQEQEQTTTPAQAKEERIASFVNYNKKDAQNITEGTVIKDTDGVVKIYVAGRGGVLQKRTKRQVDQKRRGVSTKASIDRYTKLYDKINKATKE